MLLPSLASVSHSNLSMDYTMVICESLISQLLGVTYSTAQNVGCRQYLHMDCSCITQSAIMFAPLFQLLFAPCVLHM